MIPQYRFFLQVGASGEQVAASPIYNGSLALNYELQQGQRFFRAKLNGKLTFVREDYTLIIAQPFGTVFYLHMEKSTDAAGITFEPYYKAKFTITDCTVNLDDRTIAVQPQTTDQYDKVLAGIDNEYNLITLAPAMVGVNISKRPLVQIYEAGADIINCYVAGTSWEQSCTATDDKNTLGVDNYFGLSAILIRATCDTGAYKGVYSGKVVQTGTHVDGALPYEEYYYDLENENGATDYYIKLVLEVLVGHYENRWIGTVKMMHRVGGTETEEGVLYLTNDSFNTGFKKLSNINVYFENTYIMARWLTDAQEVTGVTLYDLPADDIGGENRNYHKVARVSADCCVISTNTSLTPTEYGLVYDFREFVVSYTKGWMSSSTPPVVTDWTNNDYYIIVNVQPNDSIYIKAGSNGATYYSFLTDAFFASANNEQFPCCSGWVRVTVSANTTATATAPADANYLYVAVMYRDVDRTPVEFTINGNAVDLTLHDETQYFPINGDGLYYAPPSSLSGEWYRPIAQSAWMNGTSYWFDYVTVFQFLEQRGMSAYTLRNAYPLWSCISVLLSAMGASTTFEGTDTYSQFLYASTNPVSGTAVKLFVTPKSNILAGDYTVPALKAMTTLGQFLDMLRNVYQCYWYIDADDRMRIEHISWFKNGGSYSSTPTIGIYLTTLLEKRNDTAWAYGVNEYTYEKEEMPQRYQFEWMDDARIPFNGDAIEILSPSVTEGKVETVSVGSFSSDIDYMLLNPSVFSQDGFALIGATGSGNAWSVPFITYVQQGVTITLQNGYLAYVHLQPYYWVYDLPAKSVKINGTTYTLTYVSRHKVQKVSVPLGASDPDFLKLIKTDMGNGEIKAVSIPLTSRVAQITLNYDTQ